MTTPQNGLTVDATKLQSDITAIFLKNESEYLIEIPTTEITPELATDDLKDAQSAAEKYLNHTVQIVYNGEAKTFDKTTIGSWITFPNENGKIKAELSSDAIKSSISKYASKIDIPVIDKKISAVDENQVLQEGRQGVYIDQNDALSKILAGFASSTSSITVQAIIYTKDPQTLKVFPDEGIVPGRYSGQYIDVDVTQQLMTLFNGTEVVATYQVSTGKSSMPTPLGTRTIQDKDPRRWSNKYSLWMPWWSGIGGDYGIHELPEWPNGYKEGEAHLGVAVSHGCIRLGVGPAEMVYNWAPIGTPVYIHK